MSVVVKKLVFGTLWVGLPCVDNVGSCVYENACEYMPNYNKPDDTPCPANFTKLGAPCKCPISPGPYSVNNLQVHLEKPDIDISLNGKYEVVANFTREDEPIGCLKLDLTIQEN